jgi:ferredoxin
LLVPLYGLTGRPAGAAIFSREENKGKRHRTFYRFQQTHPGNLKWRSVVLPPNEWTGCQLDVMCLTACKERADSNIGAAHHSFIEVIK